MVRVFGSFALVLSLLVPVSAAAAQQEPGDPQAEQSTDEAVEGQPDIELGRPPSESWLEILLMRQELQAIKARYLEIHWLNEEERVRARKAAVRMGRLAFEIEQNVELDRVRSIQVSRASRLLIGRLEQLLGLLETDGTKKLDELLNRVDADLRHFYSRLPDGVLGARGLPSGSEPAEESERQKDDG